MSFGPAARPSIRNAWQHVCELDVPGLAELADRFPELVTLESVEQLAQTVRECVRKNVNDALLAGEAACLLAERLGTPESRAVAYRAKANALWFKGQCKPAIELLEQAAALFQESGQLNEVGRTLSTSIQPLILCGEYNRALSAAERARRLFTEQGDQQRLARLELNVANIYYRQEHYAEALAKYQSGYKTLLSYKDSEAIAVALHNMAVCLISLDDFGRALDVYSEARDFFEQHSMPALVSQVDYNIAYLHFLRGRHELALAGLAAARTRCEQEGDAYHAALCDLDESDVYLDLNLNAEAAASSRKAIEGFRTLGMGYEVSRSSVNAGVAAYRNRDLVSATEFFQLAKDTFTQDAHESGVLLMNIYEALLLIESGQLYAARQLCVAARDGFERLGLPRRMVLCDLLLARLHHGEGDLPSAERSCQRAIDQLQSLQAPSLAYEAYLRLGTLQEARGDDAAAGQSYEKARREVESIRNEFQFEELKIALMSDRCEVYSRLAMLCLKAGSCGPIAERAVDFVEQGKSRSLLDSVTGTSLSMFALSAASLEDQQKAQTIREQLNWYRHRIELEYLRQDGVQPRRITALMNQATACENELLRLRLATFAPNEKANYQTAPEWPIARVQSLLGPDKTLVEYFEIDNRLMAAVVTRDRVEVVPLAPLHDIRSRVRLLRYQFAKFRLGAQYTGPLMAMLTNATVDHLQALYRQTMGPLRERLSPFKHLVIVPHGILHCVPMQALHDGEQFLCDSFTMSYSPSAGMYGYSSSLEGPSEGGTLVLAHAESTLPWIQKEAEQLARVLPDAIVLTGSKATRSALETLGPSQRRIHVAAHGYFRRDNPLFSGVRLAGSQFNLYDLFKLRLPVDLLTLSGCATGMNLVKGGDELIGLTRGLLYVGVRTLLLTIWDVHDQSTALFMTSFYSQLQATNDKASAARAAMIEVRESFPHPYYWAPFTLVGKC